MGREVVCTCEWEAQRIQVKALLEPPELILRGEVRRRIPFSQIQQLRASDDRLRFVFEGESYALELGSKLALKWLQAIQTPPPSLAKKLGISQDTVVRTVGAVDDSALEEALSCAKAISDKNADMIVARVDTREDLARTLGATAKQLAARTPIWLIYRKGRGHSLSENDVRSMGLAAGVVDTKVAAVSSKLTGLRFVKRRDA